MPREGEEEGRKDSINVLFCFILMQIEMKPP